MEKTQWRLIYEPPLLNAQKELEELVLRNLFVYLIALLAAVTPALADQTSLTEEVRKDVTAPTPVERKIFDIDKAILLGFINLIRFNIHFHQQANYRWFWRDWLYPAEREAGGALVFASSVVEIQQRSRGFYNPHLISETAERKGVNCDITGHAINGSASALELAQNGMVKLIADKRGFSQKHAISFVKTEIERIDSLLAARETLVASDPTSADQKARIWEGRLLKHIRDQVLFEFTQWSISSREVAWREGVFFTIDTLQNYTVMASAIVALRAITNSRLSGPSAIVSLVGHAMEAVNPPVRTMAGRLMGKYQSRRLSKVFAQHKPRTMEQLLSDWKELEPLLSTQAKTGSLSELAFLVRRSHQFDKPLAEDVEKIERLRRVADQQAISGPMIGVAKSAASICRIVGSYDFSSEEITANRIKLAGNITDASAQGFALLATPTAFALHFLYTRQLAKTGRLPSQVLQARLRSLDGLETQIRAAKAPGDLSP